MLLRISTLLLVTALALPFATASDLDYDVGAAGKCYDSATEGGQTELILKSGADPVLLDPLEAAKAVVAFVDEPQATATGQGCASNDAVDYLEVHVYVNALGGASEVDEHVCYTGALDVAVMRTTSCYPTRP